MVELLKQPQFCPMSVGEQVITIFAVLSGLLDDIPVKEVGELVTRFLRHLAKEHPEYISEINNTKIFSTELAEKVKQALSQYKRLKS